MPHLKPFQEKGVEFLTSLHPVFHVPHKYLAWDMGTGKTPVTCVAIKRLAIAPVLIICPQSVKDTWAHRLVEWGTCEAKDIQVVRTGSDRIYRRYVIVNYELAIKDAIYKQLTVPYVLAGQTFPAWAVCVLDEAHRLQALTSKTSSRILGTKHGKPIMGNAYHRWWLSGTPARNGRPMELYPTLKTACPELIKPYNTTQLFGERFCNGERDETFRGASNLDDLYERIKPFLNVVKLEDVAPELPPVIYETAYMDIGSMVDDETNTATSTLRRLIGEQKAGFAINYLKERLAGDASKLLIFVYHRDVAERIARELNASLIYGGQSDAERKKQFESFRGHNKSCVAQIGTVGVGTDGFQYFCNQIVTVELDWVPDAQAIARLQRMGQDKQVLVTRLVAEDTLDLGIRGSSRNKERNIAQLIRSEKMAEQGIIERALNALESIATSLEMMADQAIAGQPETAKGKGGKGKTAAADAGAPKSDKPEHTLDEIKKLSQELIPIVGGEDKVTAIYLELLGKYGASKSSELKPENFDAVWTTLNAYKTVKPKSGLADI